MSEEEKPNRILKYVWNEEKGEFMGRNGIGWLLIGAFYFCLYVFLAAWFTMCLALFFETLKTTEPKWYGVDSLTLGNPGLGMRPMPVVDTTLIRFEQGKPSSYKPYTDHMEAFLLAYEDNLQQGRTLIDCPVSLTAPPHADTAACRVDIDKVIGSSDCRKEKDYGYEDGEPCILLKMNRIYGFKPEPYDSLQELLDDNELQEAPRFLAFTPGLTVGVSCEGQTAADRENILDDGVQFFPNNTDSINGYAGFPVTNFPFQNQEGYRSPFLMIKFKKFSKRVVIQIECKLYAKNIDNSGNKRRHGIISFELLKD